MTLNEQAMKAKVRAYQKWMRSEWDCDELGHVGEDLVFLYAAWGGAFANLPGREWLDALRSGDGECVPRTRRKSWRTVQKLAKRVRSESNGYLLMPWLMQPVGHWERWMRLQDVHMVGPKIAAWILRDVSLWMDTRPMLTRRDVHLGRRRAKGWYAALPTWAQAYYLPMDRWVHRACLENGVYSEADVGGSLTAMQSSQDSHHRASKRMAAWCGKRGLDAREVNIYWYAHGSGNL